MIIDGLSTTLLFLERERKNHMRYTDEYKAMVKQMEEITQLIIDLATKEVNQ